MKNYRNKTTLFHPYFMKILLLVLALFSINVGASDDIIEFKIDVEELRGADNVDIKLYVFDCGEILVRDLSLFNSTISQGTHKNFANACYLIEHPKGTLFWDGGLADSLVDQVGGVDVADGAFHLSVSKTLQSQLDDIGVDPLSVDYVAFSHLHFDHTGNANYFLNATWIIQQEEYDLAFSPEAAQFFFNPEDYAMLKDNDIIKLQGHHDVFGDKTVVIISSPGHTPGHQNLYINLPQTGPIILSGDLYHFQANREDYGVPVFNTKKETIHSFVLIDNVLDELGAKLWIQHDMPFFDSLNLAPAFYQ